MIKFLQKTKVFLIFLILMNISSLIASEISPLLNIQKANSRFSNDIDVIHQLINEDGLLDYDRVISLFEEIENGNLDDVLTEKDLYKINLFLTYIVEKGLMPNIDEKEKIDIEEDIQNLLNPYDSAISSKNLSYQIENPQFLYAMFYEDTDTVLCKNWVKKPSKHASKFIKKPSKQASKFFKKQCKHTAKFIKKHKTLIVIGVVAVVATVAVISTVAIASAAAASSGSTIAAADSYATDSKTQKSSSAEEFIRPSENVIAQDSVSNSIKDQILNYKEIIYENYVVSNSTDQNYLSNNEKILGSNLAHSTLDNIYQNYYDKNYENSFIQAHGKIDKVFSTDQSSLYIDNNKSNTFYENNFYLQGQEALKNNYYDIAIDNFNESININPNNHNVFLERGYALLQTGEFDKSLKDYNHYRDQNNQNIKNTISFIDCFDFSKGMTTGITKGALESGKQLISFAASVIANPSKTYSSFVESIQMLSDLAKENEWNALSKVVFPEVCEIIDNWDNLSPQEKGEKSGYIIGKYGADILIPGAGAKVISQGIKGAKELTVIAKNLQRTQQVIVLEALAETGGSSGKFAETIYAWKSSEQISSQSSGLLKSIKNSSSITTKNDFLNLIMHDGKLIGKKGSSDFIRLFQGGKNEGMEIFKELTKFGKLVRSEKNIIIYKISDDIYITYRPVSTSGPPTIDIKLPDMEHNIKFKFLEK